MSTSQVNWKNDSKVTTLQHTLFIQVSLFCNDKDFLVTVAESANLLSSVVTTLSKAFLLSCLFLQSAKVNVTTVASHLSLVHNIHPYNYILNQLKIGLLTTNKS